MVKLKYVPGLMVEKEEVEVWEHQDICCSGCEKDGMNKALFQMGEREITINREKLNKIIKNELNWQNSDDYPSLSREEFGYHLVDVIITALRTILEAKNV